VVQPVTAPVITPIPIAPAPAPPVAAPAPAPAKRSPEAVQAKYMAVHQEYVAFKREYGGILEEKWTAIVNEVTYGKANKFERLDAMLDSLRKDMGKVKSGG
jgi:hypothetical protein